MSASDTAFLAFIAGTSAAAFELIRPGLYLPGILGPAVALGGAFVLCAGASRPLALAFALAAAALLLIAQNWSRVPLVCGVSASLALAASLALWSKADPRLAISLTLAAGLAFTLLLDHTKRARLNKAPGAAG